MPRRIKTPRTRLPAPTGVGISELFDKCVIKTCRCRSIRCCIGLWGVSAPDAATAEREARHYWQQYHADGEYAAHLSNKKLCNVAAKPKETQ